MLNFDVQGALFPNPFTMLIQLMSTLILFIAVKKFLWGPAKKILNARSEKMQSDLNEAENAKEEAYKQLSEARGELTKAYKSSEEIISGAKTEATQIKENIMADAKREAMLKINEGERRVQMKKKEAESQMYDEIVQVALAATSKLLDEKSTSEDDNAAISKFVKEISESEQA